MRPKQEAPAGHAARASISGTIPLRAKLIPVPTDSTNGEKIKAASHAKIKMDHSQVQKGPVRGCACPITNDATPKQIAAVKLIDSKGSHVWT